MQPELSFQPMQLKPINYNNVPPLASIYEQAINLVQSPISQEVAREMEAVEELVRSRVEDLLESCDDDNTSESGTSASSMSTASFSPRSDTFSSSNDDDWTSSSMGQYNQNKSNFGKMKSGQCVDGQPKKKTRMYGRSTEDRKHRKKEQNKNAANRYRLKKKAEVEIILEEERDLAKVHDDLKTRFEDLKREKKYLKGLLRELYQQRGLLD